MTTYSSTDSIFEFQYLRVTVGSSLIFLFPPFRETNMAEIPQWRRADRFRVRGDFTNIPKTLILISIKFLYVLSAETAS